MIKALRINFELARADNPPLYDELAKFTKGTKRASRLRTLAHAGLMAQLTCAETPSTAPSGPQMHDCDPTCTAATMELFGPSIQSS